MNTKSGKTGLNMDGGKEIRRIFFWNSCSVVFIIYTRKNYLIVTIRRLFEVYIICQKKTQLIASYTHN